MKLKQDFVERLKNAFESKNIHEIVFGLDVFDDMEEDDYIVFSKIYNKYIDDTREGVQNALDR